MRKMRNATVLATLLFVALALNVPRAAADMDAGTWKMNPALSKYSPGPAPKSVTVKIESDAENFKLTSDGIDASGNPTHIEYKAKFDGKDYPITGLPNADTVSVKRVAVRTIESTVKKDGKVVMTVRSEVSADRKTRTSTFKGTDAQGNEVNNVVVYERQL